MQRARRLLIVSPTFWPEPVGTPKYALDAARWFHRQGWQVAVVTAQPFYPQFQLYEGWGRTRRRDLVHQVPVVRTPTIVPRGGRAAWRMASDLNFAAQVAVRGLQRTIPAPDAILSFSPGVPMAVAAAAAFGRQIPHSTIVHDIQSGLARSTGLATGRIADVMAAVEAACLSLPDRLFALSTPMAEELRAIGARSPVDVVPIWADIPVARAAATARGGPLTALYSGNFGRKQGIPLLLDAATALQRRGSDVRLVLRGDGALRGQAEATISDRGLRNTSVVDFVPADQLAASLLEADVHVVPQLSGSGAYAMPSKVINILASGVPMLAVCDTGDPLHDLSQEGLGLWSPVDPEVVADRLEALARDRRVGRYVAEAGLDHVARHHDRDVLLSQVEASLV